MSRRSMVAAVRRPVLDEDAEFQIESGIEVPQITRAKRYDLGLEQLKVGQSKFVPIADKDQEKSLQGLLNRYAKLANIKSDGELDFTVRRMLKNPKEAEHKHSNPIGFRIFRIEA